MFWCFRRWFLWSSCSSVRAFRCRKLWIWLIAWDPQRAEVTSHYVPLKPAQCSQHNQTGERCDSSFFFLYFSLFELLRPSSPWPFLSLSLCSGCIVPKQKWHAGNYVMLYWCNSWHRSAWFWVSLLCHKRKTLLLNSFIRMWGFFWLMIITEL